MATKKVRRAERYEARHDKFDDLKQELRIISMEYADIRARIEATDIYINHMVRKLDEEASLRKINLVLVAVLLFCVITILVLVSSTL
ncbi:MAG: hypothetical protein JXB14_04485 [Candidatus Altiarchaeota archaeon]|nr:hypothetical protein [Candidatus Altiarchaeota archaeon]